MSVCICIYIYIYIRFQACFRLIRNITKFAKKVFGKCLGNPILQYWRSLLFIKLNISSHLKLEIVLAIPASNDEK